MKNPTKPLPHQFIFTPGQWIGEGKITFLASKEHLRFFTKWTIAPKHKGAIVCLQQVEMEGGSGTVNNTLTFQEITSEKFTVELTSDQLQEAQGTGIIDTETIAWEFVGLPDFEGFEVYERQENGDYMFHAEYATLTHMRTIIDGRIWLKS